MTTHRCKACLVSCMDFRLNQVINGFLESQGLDTGGSDIIRVGGAAMSLARPQEPRDREFLLNQLDIAYRLHGVRHFYLANHEDCGAYGLEDVPDSEEELQIHAKDLATARAIVEQHLIGVQVTTLFLWLDGRVDTVE